MPELARQEQISPGAELRVAPRPRRLLKAYLLRECPKGMITGKGLLFRLAALEGDRIVGVVTVGRPKPSLTRHPRITAVWQLVMDRGRADVREVLLAAAARTVCGMGCTGLVTDRSYRRAAPGLTRAGAELYGSTSLLRFRGADAGKNLKLARGWVWKLGAAQ